MAHRHELEKVRPQHGAQEKMKPHQIVAKRLKEWRADQGLSYAQLSERCGIEAGRIAQIESGNCPTVMLGEIEKLSDVLNLVPTALLTTDEDLARFDELHALKQSAVKNKLSITIDIGPDIRERLCRLAKRFGLRMGKPLTPEDIAHDILRTWEFEERRTEMRETESDSEKVERYKRLLEGLSTLLAEHA